MNKRPREVIQPVQGQARVFLVCKNNLPIKAHEDPEYNKYTEIQKAIIQNKAERMNGTSSTSRMVQLVLIPSPLTIA